jgi:hypothetical protein
VVKENKHYNCIKNDFIQSFLIIQMTETIAASSVVEIEEDNSLEEFMSSLPEDLSDLSEEFVQKFLTEYKSIPNEDGDCRKILFLRSYVMIKKYELSDEKNKTHGVSKTIVDDYFDKYLRIIKYQITYYLHYCMDHKNIPTPPDILHVLSKQIIENNESWNALSDSCPRHYISMDLKKLYE